uniref:Cell adhesion molecule-related/down-regulated by oncogenes n=1 Tax=Ectopleura larynx TaxID=264052 RepID=V9GWB1_9CNID
MSKTCLLAYLFFLATCAVKCQGNSCPGSCTCLPNTLKCINVGLTQMPTSGFDENTTVLDLRYNAIEEIRKVDFAKFKNLKNLFLGNNNIRSIEDDTFSHLRELKHLYMFSNNIQQVGENTFRGLTNLHQLYLQNNQLKEISPRVFKDLISLRRLYLHGNVLKSFSKETLRPMRSLKRLRMGFNRFPCTCSFIYMVKEITLQGKIDLDASCFQGSYERNPAASIRFADLGCYRPKFITKPYKQQGVQGKSVEMTCKAEGYPLPTVSWLKDGVQVEIDSTTTEVKDDGTLVLNSLTKDSAGYYQCVIKNDIGKESAGASLVVISGKGIPSFIERPSNVDVIVGSIARFNCRGNGYPKPQILWIKNGQLIQNSDRFRILPTGDLEIRNVQIDDTGYYTCRVENIVGSVIHDASLFVKAPPNFIRQPEDMELLDGGTASFECRASGYPQPAIAWQKDGKRLPTDERHVVLPSGTLRILYVSKANEGDYECQAINVIGVISATASLTIKSRVKPSITVKPADVTIQSGNTILLQCRGTGAPEPIISWVRNGVQLTTGNRFKVNSKEGTIRIKDIGNIDAGRWECMARNSFGVASESFSVTVVGSKSYEGDQFVLQALEKAKNEVDRAFESTKQKLRNFSPSSPSDLLALFRFPSPEAVKIARSAEIFEIAIELIQKSVDSGILDKNMKQRYNFNALVSPEHIRLLANLSGCTAHHRLVNCSDLCFHKQYRTYDGSCNNLQHPMWGASLTPFTRLLVPNYDNGFNTPIGWNRTGLPSARKISMNVISSGHVTSDEDLTHMVMQWGQFMDHDMDFTVTSPSTARFNDGKSCSDSCENEQPCFPIKVPEDDPRIKRYKCMEFTRSSAVCGSGSTSVFFDSITPRQQINQITSFIDASNVYGSTKKEAEELRTYDDESGFLKRGIHYRNGKFLLPFNQDSPIDCQVNKSESRMPCFLAGDHRANEHLGLLSMHTLWMRQHNRLAAELKRINPHWNGDKTYQEARKIVGAQMQHISYTEWLPKILGKHGMETLGEYKGYDPTVEPSIINVFATAAFRFGHTLIQPILARLNENFTEIKEGSLPLHKAFFSPYRLVEEGGVDPIQRGLFGWPVKDRRVTDQLFTTELTERLFAMAHAVALDLGALNIQRGRDHGLPNYNSWRQFCNLSVAKNFDDLQNEIKNNDIRDRIKKVYKSVNLVDLYVGANAEDSLPGSRLGPTFMCLILLQMKRTRDGDRFWYENPSTFKPEQFVQIKQTTLAHVICENSDNIRHVQRDVFLRAKRLSDYIPCSKHKVLDLRFWKECCPGSDCGSNDKSITLSNTIRNSRSTRKTSAKGSRRSRRSLDNTFNSTKEDIGKDQPKEDENIKQSMKIKTQIDSLQREIQRIEDFLKELKSEVKNLIRKIEPRRKSKKQKKGCVSWSIVHDHEESWYGEKNKKCICQNGKVTCI